jgi:hypothetical protein
VTAFGGPSCSAAVEAGACTLTLDTPGDFTLTASYAGDARFAPSAGTESHRVEELEVD